MKITALLASFTLLVAAFGCQPAKQQPEENTASTGHESQPQNQSGISPAEVIAEKINGAGKPRNVIFILSDDHRYDFMGFTGKVPWLETPNMDKLAKEGVHCENAFVATALCSPSRASILTGLYPHSHTVVDNHAPDPGNLKFFPEYLQKAGYQTSFFGKWHMEHGSDDPKPGFNHWESFKGQGKYYDPTLNINGEHKKFEGEYITDLLTDHLLDWLGNRDKEKPFFAYLSHKAVHASFKPSPRHKGKYADKQPAYPPSYFMTQDNRYKEDHLDPFKEIEFPSPQSVGVDMGEYAMNPDGVPDWVKKQRYSWHGTDYMYHGQMDFETFYRRYNKTILGVDESIGRVMDYLKDQGLDESTLVIYMGDNGFSFGEHGLIDKRHAYEESMKVPLLVRCPELFQPSQTMPKMIMNTDIAPTILEVAGVKTPPHMQGESFVDLLSGKDVTWRDRIFYEYFWEFDFPQTPTLFSIRTDNFKYIRYHGIWDTNELFDIKNDPYEMNNLISNPAYQDTIKQLAGELYDFLEETNGMQIPLKRTVKPRYGDHMHPKQL